jgi:hypothetical protein
VEQTREPMDKNRIRGLQCRAKRQRTTKPISIKGTGGKSAGCAWKVIEPQGVSPRLPRTTGGETVGPLAAVAQKSDLRRFEQLDFANYAVIS